MRPESTPELIAKAQAFVLEKPSVSYIQRKLMIGYNHACELMEYFERRGLVSKPNAAGVRVILTRNGEASIADAEINRANFAAFIARAINFASVSAVDAEFGLRVRAAEVTALGNIVIECEGGVALVLAGMPVSREIADVN